MSFFDSKRSIDLISMGRVAVDLYAEQVSSHLHDVQTFCKYLGGCAGNVAVGTARLGLNSAILSSVGHDAMGEFITNELHKENVDISFLFQSDKHLTAMVMLGIDPPDSFPMIYYRENCADMQLQQEHCEKKFFARAKALYLTGSGLVSDSIRKTTNFAMDLAISTKTAIVFDLDYRPAFWGLVPKGDGETRNQFSSRVTKHYQAVLPNCTIIYGTEDEIRMAGGSQDITKALKKIRTLSKAVIIVKSNEFGCDIYTDEIDQPLSFPGFPVTVFNSKGASDVFLSGFLAGWLQGESWKKSAQLANAVEAIVVTRHGCAPALPCRSEVNYFIEKYTTDPNVVYQEKINQLHRNCGSRSEKKRFVLAFDHRWQFEQSCDDVGRARSVISAFKQQIFQGFLQIREQNPEYNLAIRADFQYSQSIIREANNLNIPIGVPIEAGGSFPVQWVDRRPLYEQILVRPANFNVKVLWQYHPDFEASIKLRQLSQLRLLSSVCSALDRKLVVELAIPAEYKRDGKYVAKALTQVYEHDIYPSCWKLLPMFSYSEWQLINDVLEKFDPTTKIILLGGNYIQYEDWAEHFQLFKRSKYAHGFTIGRSTFWEPWQQFISGEITLDDVPALVAQNLQTFIDYWNCSEKIAEKVL